MTCLQRRHQRTKCHIDTKNENKNYAVSSVRRGATNRVAFTPFMVYAPAEGMIRPDNTSIIVVFPAPLPSGHTPPRHSKRTKRAGEKGVPCPGLVRQVERRGASFVSSTQQCGGWACNAQCNRYLAPKIATSSPGPQLPLTLSRMVFLTMGGAFLREKHPALGGALFTTSAVGVSAGVVPYAWISSLGAAAPGVPMPGGGGAGAAAAGTMTSTHKFFQTSVTGFTAFVTVKREFAKLLRGST
jgi:hypothetical protein